MTTAKVAVTIPADILRLAKKEIGAGRAKSLSAYISQAVDEKLQRDLLFEVLDAMDREQGRPNRSAQVWARKVLRSSS